MFEYIKNKFLKGNDHRNNERIAALNQKAQQLSLTQEYDLIDLYKMGFLKTFAIGQSITHVKAELVNLTNRDIRIKINPGTYFVSGGEHQNMVVRNQRKINLPANTTDDILVAASCINADRPIPTQQDRFQGLARVPDSLQRFLDHASHLDPMVVQAGVWAITDQYTERDIRNHLVNQDQFGISGSAISRGQIEEARRLLNDLNINHNL